MEDKPLPAESTRASRLLGTITVPGDKSISHRALMLASQTLGRTEIHGLLEGEDVMRTEAALRACGVPISRMAGGVWQVNGLGIGGLHAPEHALDMGNAGTAARLMMGLLAPYPYRVEFTGDASLRKRPMQRVMTPLQHIGVQFESQEGGRLPMTMQGTGMPLPMTYTLPVASAQVKSAVLLAGLNTPGITTVIEAEPTRDHTERMLKFFGVEIISSTQASGGVKITLHGQPAQKLENRVLRVPADPSSAAFPLVAALLVPDSQITLEGVCLNRARTGLFDVLNRMGANLIIHREREVGGEPVGDITVRSSTLRGVEVEAQIAPSMIDEYPILAVAAAYATGTTLMRGLGELRVKESDRLAAIVAGLGANGVRAEAVGDDLIVHGMGGHLQGGGTVATHFDHRIAMSFLVMGLASERPVSVDDTRAIATSFPGFMELMTGLGAKIEYRGESGISARKPEIAKPEPLNPKPLVIAVDGPAASGKGTLARRLADYFGLGYLDTGSLYRAAAMRLLYADKDPADIAAAIASARSITAQDLANPKLRGERIGQAASLISAIPEVREALFDYQRQFAARPEGAALDGRDIGTVICPEAQVKIFITASLEARANRRHRQLEDYGVKVEYQSVYDDLAARDARDASRTIAPLKPAADAISIDTSAMSANEVFEWALNLIMPKAHR